ncbi:2-hydroxyacid dehydrogenase [Nocardioides korecus]
MSDPLVWLPFDPAELTELPGTGELPTGLRYEHVDPEVTGDADRWSELPASLEEVAFQVMHYRFSRPDGELLARMPRLEVVQTQTAGVEHVRGYVPDGVLLCNGRGIHDTATAELALTLALASQRDLPDHARAQAEGRWAPRTGRSLADTTVLIVGYGQIGEAIEARLRPFEVSEVLRVARSAREGVSAIEDLPDLLPRANVVVVVVPGTAETRSLFDAAMLARMRDDALLVNVARGPVVDTEALLAELTSGRLRAALDVTDPEPLPEGHPLWTAPGLLLTPHVGGASTAMRPRALRLVREQLQRFAAGEPVLNVVTGDY